MISYLRFSFTRRSAHPFILSYSRRSYVSEIKWSISRVRVCRVEVKTWSLNTYDDTKNIRTYFLEAVKWSSLVNEYDSILIEHITTRRGHVSLIETTELHMTSSVLLRNTILRSKLSRTVKSDLSVVSIDSSLTILDLSSCGVGLWKTYALHFDKKVKLEYTYERLSVDFGFLKLSWLWE